MARASASAAATGSSAPNTAPMTATPAAAAAIGGGRPAGRAQCRYALGGDSAERVERHRGCGPARGAEGLDAACRAIAGLRERWPHRPKYREVGTCGGRIGATAALCVETPTSRDDPTSRRASAIAMSRRADARRRPRRLGRRRSGIYDQIYAVPGADRPQRRGELIKLATVEIFSRSWSATCTPDGSRASAPSTSSQTWTRSRGATRR